MSGIVDSLLPVIDSILGVRDTIGAVKLPVYLLTRTWSGARVGDGTATDVKVQMLPSPGIKDYAQARIYSQNRAGSGGFVDSREMQLMGISKHAYPTESVVRCLSSSPSIELFYVVGSDIYSAVSVNSNYLTWDVQLKKLSNQTRY